MKRTLAATIITLIVSLAFALTATAQHTPRWVLKGTASINKERSNDTYTVESFNTYNAELSVLESHATDVLKKYVLEHYNAYLPSIAVTELAGGVQPLYEVTYSDAAGNNYKVMAKRIDVFTDFDDYELNVYQFEYHQLYAISKPNVVPMFDQFIFTEKYQGVTTAMAFVPGMAQLYKGQNTKGYVIIGAEVFFAGAFAIFDYYRRDDKKHINGTTVSDGSWNSKQNAWKNFEYGALGGFAAVYIYNIIDGMTSKGAKQVKVVKATAPQFTLMPYASNHEAGMAFSLRF